VKRPRIRRRIVVGGLVVVVAVVLALLALDRPSAISGFRIADDRTLVVTSIEGPGALTRVSSVVETPTTVTVTVSSILFRPGPGTDEGVPVESVVRLRDPINGRAVVDGSSGQPVLQTP
jgi:hypothetical protein